MTADVVPNHPQKECWKVAFRSMFLMGKKSQHFGASSFSKKLRKRANLTGKGYCSSKEPWESQKEFSDELQLFVVTCDYFERNILGAQFYEFR